MDFLTVNNCDYPVGGEEWDVGDVVYLHDPTSDSPAVFVWFPDAESDLAAQIEA